MRRVFCWFLPWALGVGALHVSARASAQEAPAGGGSGELPRSEGAAGSGRAGEVAWNPAWPEFRTSQWLVSAGALGVFLVSKFGPQPDWHWRGSTTLDDSVRSAVRLDSAAARDQASILSHVGMSVSMAWSFFDASVVAAGVHRQPKVGWQQGLITAETLAVTAALQGVVSTLSGRERPYGPDCGRGLDADSRECATRYRYWSFYSAHSAFSFAGAGATCMHHAYVPLYGGGTGDALACMGALGVAASTAALRLAADVHYMSDVLMGSAMGLAAGILVPWGLHYRHGDAAGASAGASAQAASPAGYERGTFLLLPEGMGVKAVWVY